MLLTQLQELPIESIGLGQLPANHENQPLYSKHANKALWIESPCPNWIRVLTSSSEYSPIQIKLKQLDDEYYSNPDFDYNQL